MAESSWQFWIDVGGTFTDCIAQRPDGTLIRHKLLSSGVTKGVVRQGSSVSTIFSGRSDPDDFWRNYQLRLLGPDGDPAAEVTVRRSRSDDGSVQLSAPLPWPPTVGASFELSSDEEAPILAIRQMLGLRRDQPIPRVGVRLGTTRGTNALLTRTGARTAFVTTAGFGDILRIGYQNRPHLFELAIRKPAPLFAETAEIQERVAVDGTVLIKPSAGNIRSTLEGLRARGIESLAICLLNAYRYSEHEELVERIAQEVGFDEISRSSRVAPLMKLVSRGDTTVVDAYLNPVLRDYVGRLRESLGEACDLRLLTSAGGLVAADRFVGKDSILSGPAGGVVGFSRVAEAAGHRCAIGFDMGGTSTDVSRYDGRFELEYETEKAGVRVVAPMMSIETVAAGGGSICWFDGVKLCVGPNSAGADPGPACYGRGGPLAVTDVNLVLGKILPENFPFAPDKDAALDRLDELRTQVHIATGKAYEPGELAEGFLRVANANMAKAIRSISIAKGYDPRAYLLVAFGGAAPQHACAIANELGIERILNHPDAGILSALGAGMADVTRHRVLGVYRPYNDMAVRELGAKFDAMAEDASREVADEGISPRQIEVTRSLDLRYQGVNAFLNIRGGDGESYADTFEREHQRLYGYVHEDRSLEIVAARVEVIGRSATRLPESSRASRVSIAAPDFHRSVSFAGDTFEAGVYQRAGLEPGHQINGPAIVLEQVSTTVIDPGWRAEMLSGGELLLTHDPDAAKPTTSARPASPVVDAGPDPVMLEIFNNHFAGIAEQMGNTLRNTSSSVNVKERLDFSCALFTAEGDLVVNAPHIPVHLGAMGETVKRVIADNRSLGPGDVVVTNDPYRGGSHLPDITVVSPVHDARTGRIRFFTASRAHHAELGGITPGSMPPFSKNLSEEGVLIRNLKVVDGGVSCMDALRQLLLSGPYPTRSVHDNLADIAAQIAANHQGARDLIALIERLGWETVSGYMRYIQQAAEQKTRRALHALPDGRREFVDHLDNGAPIAVAVTVDGDSATIDFTGTGDVLDGNLNANRAIVTAAVMYCLRCLIDQEIPLNQGVLAPIEIVLPKCLLNPPEGDSAEACAAVVGGNVETSQRVVDVLLGAFGLAAASQGTMNNTLFGDSTFGYYETICGGSGATATADGASAVHTHMTNTRLTDPEVLEDRYPVRLLEFAIRRGSGGDGAHRGGDGVIRRLEFLRDVELSLLSQRRGPYAPYGLDGGESGALGRNVLVRQSGEFNELPNAAQVAVNAGDILTIETPGGGGFGASKS